jgi:hypothetical protein
MDAAMGSFTNGSPFAGTPGWDVGSGASRRRHFQALDLLDERPRLRVAVQVLVHDGQ